MSMAILNSFVASGDTPLDAVTVKVEVPVAVGVPEITPAFKLKPAGRLPAVTDHVMGTSPVA